MKLFKGKPERDSLSFTYRAKHKKVLSVLAAVKLREHSHFGGPALTNAAFAGVIWYVGASSVVRSYWHAPTGVMEAFALGVAVFVYAISPYKTYADKIFAMLSDYKPVDVRAFRELQSEVRRDSTRIHDPMRVWIERELMAIADAQAHASPQRDDSPRSAFLGALPVPDMVGINAPADQDNSELAALRMAVSMMGFDPQALAAFVSEQSDWTCKSILLGSLSVDDAILRERGASETGPWREYLSQLRNKR